MTTGPLFKFGGKSYSSISAFPPGIVNAPITGMTLIDLSANAPLPEITRGLWTGAAGAVVDVIFADGSEVTAFPLSPGWNKLLVKQVKSSTEPLWAIK